MLGGHGSHGAGNNNMAYAASPANTARGHGKKVRDDDGFHTRPVRSERSRLRKLAVFLTALACVIAAIFVLRAVGDRDERIPEALVCTDLYEPDVCALELPE